MAVFTSVRLSVPAVVDTDTCSLTTDTGSDVTETDNAASLSDENTETESVITTCNTPTSELGEREVRFSFCVSPSQWHSCD